MLDNGFTKLMSQYWTSAGTPRYVSNATVFLCWVERYGGWDDSCKPQGCCNHVCKHDSTVCPPLDETLQTMKSKGIRFLVSEIDRPATKKMLDRFADPDHYGDDMKRLDFSNNDPEALTSEITGKMCECLLLDYF